MKWQMIDFTHFIGFKENYQANIRKGGLGWVWELFRDGFLIDRCYYHKPTDSELACKVQVQRIVEKLLNSEQSVKGSDTTEAK